MKIRPRTAEVFLSPCRARQPFRFGMITMTAAPLATCRVEVELESGELAVGYSSDLLVPKWFEKNPATPITQDWADLLAAQRAAIFVLLDHVQTADSVFGHWLAIYTECVASAAAEATDLLVRGEGVSLLERAMIDAVCRHAGLGLSRALREGLLGFDTARLDSALVSWRPSERLREPVDHVALRHTVGLVDALEPDDLTSATRVGDGLPECLADDIRAFDLTHFKIKIAGDAPDQVERLARIWSLIRRECGRAARITLDGNEQFESIDQLADLMERVAGDPRFDGLTDALLMIEQPLPRTRTFDPQANRGLSRLDRFAPCIIDEADTRLESLAEAAALGYRGVSVKNCKGVFRALINRARCDLSNARLFQSAEDLTNLPVLALQQDLATVATLGITHVERNGHHYFRGLAHLPLREQSWAIDHHADLYTADRSPPTLRIVRGGLRLSSLLAAPGFGYAGPIETDQRTPSHAWDPASLL